MQEAGFPDISLGGTQNKRKRTHILSPFAASCRALTTPCLLSPLAVPLISPPRCCPLALPMRGQPVAPCREHNHIPIPAPTPKIDFFPRNVSQQRPHHEFCKAWGQGHPPLHPIPSTWAPTSPKKIHKNLSKTWFLGRVVGWLWHTQLAGGVTLEPCGPVHPPGTAPVATAGTL